MSYVRRIFPDTFIPPLQAFNLLLLAEGFTEAGRDIFAGACSRLVQNLLRTTPYNLTRCSRGWINIYRDFTPSAVAGPSIDAVPGDTAFGSTYDSHNHTLSLDPTRVTSVIAGLSARGEGAEVIDASEIWPTGPPRMGLTGSTTVVLLPLSVNGTPVSAELEHIPGESDTWFVATTIDGLWHQVVARLIGHTIGLGDEYELAGIDFGSPSSDEGNRLDQYPNLAYLPTPPTDPPSMDFKWYPDLYGEQTAAPLPVVPHPGPPDTPDYTVPPVPLTTPSLQLVEGGGGYRSQVYRTSQDCLMRRKVGGRFLSIKDAEIPFCVICQRFLQRGLVE